MADLLPNRGLPSGAQAEFKRLTRDLGKDLMALVMPEITRAIETGTIREKFDDDLKKLITAWRNDAQVAVFQELSRLYRREVNRYGSYYRGKIKGIVKPETPISFPNPALAIDAVAKSIWTSATDIVKEARLVYTLTQGAISG